MNHGEWHLSETLNHPSPERLEAFVEESLDGADAAVVGSHLATCEQCQLEVSELRSLFEAFAALPELAPSHGFADRVMAGVRVRRPWLEVVGEWVDRLTPDTNRGWALAAALVAMPVLVLAGSAWWLLSQPGMSPQAVWLVVSSVTAEGLVVGWQWALATFARSNLAAWLSGLMGVASSVGRGGLGLAAVMFATMTLASIYILYENLFRPRARRAEHASYSF
jgi:anti-sigma factor RsiW